MAAALPAAQAAYFFALLASLLAVDKHNVIVKFYTVQNSALLFLRTCTAACLGETAVFAFFCSAQTGYVKKS